MEINLFNDPHLAPQPRHKVKIESIGAQPYADRFRVKVNLKLTPFQERPNLLITARSADGLLVSDLDVIATMHFENEYTLHIRGLDEPSGDFTLTAELYYETRDPPQDKREIAFHIPLEER